MIHISIPRPGYSGINDGLRWKNLETTIGTKSPGRILTLSWWWRSKSLRPASASYLVSRRDRGGCLPFTYEAVARLCGRYPYSIGESPEGGGERELVATPFNLLPPEQADVFAEIFNVSEDPRLAPAYLLEHDPYTSYPMKPIGGEGVSLIRDINAVMIEFYRCYSGPVRFKLLSSRKELHEALDRFLDAIKHDPKKSKDDFPQTGRLMRFKDLESWDWRRWREDFSGTNGSCFKLERLPSKLWPSPSAPPRVNNSAVTRARQFAIDAVKRAKAHVKAMDPSKHLTGAEKELVTFVKAIRFDHE